MQQTVGRVEGVFVGPVKTYAAPDGANDRVGPWTSGIDKSPVVGPVKVESLGLAGDAQADLTVHGGPDGAVMAYAASHYAQWEQDIGRPVPFGSFGENLTVSGFEDSGVCLGDLWEVGEAGGLLMQVTQPRQPCYKLARRLNEPRVVKWVTERCNGGWYFRILRPGPVEAGMTIRLVKQGLVRWPVSEAVRVMYAKGREDDAARALRDVEPLSERWKIALSDV